MLDLVSELPYGSATGAAPRRAGIVTPKDGDALGRKAVAHRKSKTSAVGMN